MSAVNAVITAFAPKIVPDVMVWQDQHGSGRRLI